MRSEDPLTDPWTISGLPPPFAPRCSLSGFKTSLESIVRLAIINRYCSSSSLPVNTPHTPSCSSHSRLKGADLIEKVFYTVSDLILTAVRQMRDLFDPLLSLLHEVQRSCAARDK